MVEPFRKRPILVRGPDADYEKWTFIPDLGRWIPEYGHWDWAGYAKASLLHGKQETASENHPVWKSPRKGPVPGDVGGNFRTMKLSMTSKIVKKGLSAETTGAGGSLATRTSYSGPIFPIGTFGGSSPYPPSWESNDLALYAKGTTAIANCKPTNNVADAATFLGELTREGIPGMVGSSTLKDKTQRARDAVGGDYLAAEFGWKPIARDVAKFIHQVTHADAVLAQYERDAGGVVRRRFVFPSEQEVSEVRVAVNVRPWLPFAIPVFDTTKPPMGEVYRVRTKTRRQWFSGAFTYHLPSGYTTREGMARDAARTRKLLGLQLSPDVVWNLAPWSWAVDWFSNAGDVVSNLSDMATDGLVLRYGYIMEHSSVTDTYHFSGPTGFHIKSAHVQPQTISFTTEVKKRLRATPFGFGLNWSQLTPRQLAIIAALGLTRS